MWANGLRYWALGRAWIHLGSRKNSKPEKCLKMPQHPQRPVHRMLKYKVEYETLSVEEYEKQYQEQQLKYVKKRAARLGYQLTPA